jgi:hypothetical protein
MAAPVADNAAISGSFQLIAGCPIIAIEEIVKRGGIHALASFWWGG